MSESSDVEHQMDARRFVLRVDGHELVLEYERGVGTIDFQHTFTPPELRGRGLAGTLVTAGLDYARDQGLKVIPSCSYVAGFIDRHPEYQDLR